MHIEYVANGMGSQSMYLLYLASQKKIPATLSFTADTGWENDCDLNDGTKTTARDFFDDHLNPLAKKWGIPAYFVRAVDNKGVPHLSIPDYIKKYGKATIIPLFGSNGGRMRQNCTDKWKVKAMSQQARRLGAKTARSAQGILFSERANRVKGKFLGVEGGFNIYRSTYPRKDQIVEVKWRSHYYPLVDLQMNRQEVRNECDRLGIPYLISSECAGCPHADAWRWMRRSAETIEQVGAMEASFGGEYFFTKQLRPLKEVIADFKKNSEEQPGLFDCTGGLCGT